jgi:nitrite reductase (NO-forming)
MKQPKAKKAIAVTSLFLSYGLVAFTLLRPDPGKGNELPTETAVLTDAPNVPPPIARKSPARVVVHLEVKEVEARIADGVTYTFWTFGGHVPGKFIRVREDDLVEFHLDNHPDNKMPHNIDLHAVSGPGGGAASSLTAPGHSSVFSFRALNPGLYVYHCATAPVPMHVGNGMYGLILVEPKKGLPRVDHEYYVMQGEFYAQRTDKRSPVQTFSMPKALDERPDYVVFNGSVGALTGDGALQGKVGETIRLFVGNGGPNLTSSFHVIGGILERVWSEGNTELVEKNVQTTTVPPGGAAVAELRMKVPGNYILVDHSLTRAFNKGAIAQLSVSGPEDKTIYSGKIADEPYAPAGQGALIARAAGSAPVAAAGNKADRIAAGAQVFKTNCMACHQSNGQGLPQAFPPLAGSDYLKSGNVKLIQTVTGGLQGKVVVNGQEYNGIMPAWALSDEEIASVLTFIMNSWGNPGKDITPAEVRTHRVRKGETANRAPAEPVS